jgi:hypothetical protein
VKIALRRLKVTAYGVRANWRFSAIRGMPVFGRFALLQL